MIFSVVLAIAASRRRFGALSLPRFATFGAVAGILRGGFAISKGAPLLFLGITTFGSAIAASSSLVLARIAERRELLNPTGGVSDVGLAEGEMKELLGDRD